MADPLDLLDQSVDGFGGSVGDAAGVEVGQQLVPPGVQGAGEPDQFGDLVLGDGGEPAQQPPFGPVPGRLSIQKPEVLGGDPGSADLLVVVAGGEPGQQPRPGPFGVVLVPAA